MGDGKRWQQPLPYALLGSFHFISLLFASTCITTRERERTRPKKKKQREQNGRYLPTPLFQTVSQLAFRFGLLLLFISTFPPNTGFVKRHLPGDLNCNLFATPALAESESDERRRRREAGVGSLTTSSMANDSSGETGSPEQRKQE
jgi:hypothetical protein